ncbi:Myosin-like coiled-coil protein, putative [Angomonas deanei]|uniref:Myosin-like coiled-coil protein, putative n=1 Tax=Angomonas deanei TaxID=59799 RepID=A0A7G2C0C1_9TRYP|nr:Myosin-like coiled-coil protein, putative [Angomonas deanei]
MSAFSERLVQQMMRRHQREVELEIETSRLNEKLKKQEELQVSLEQATAQLDKLEGVRAALQKLNDDTEEEFNRARERDTLERKQLSGGFNQEIEAIQGQMQAATERLFNAKNQNKTYKHQLNVYNEIGFGDRRTKVEEAIEARSDQIQSLKEKAEVNRSSIPAMLEEIEGIKEKVAVARGKRDTVQAEVNVFVERFATIRGNLDRVKQLYESAKEQKDRQDRTIKNLESDSQSALTRAKNVKTERLKEQEKYEAMNAKVSTLKSQVEKLESLLAVLQGGGSVAAGNTSEPQETSPEQADEEEKQAGATPSA